MKRTLAVVTFLFALSCSVAFAGSETGVQLTPQKKFVFRHLAAGTKVVGEQLFYQDFAIVVSSFDTDKDVFISVRLTSEDGLNFTYENDNLGLPLKMLVGEEKRTVMLNVTSVAFPFEEYHEGITVEVEADAPVYVVPPKLFSTSAAGERDRVAELAWEGFGFQVPTVRKDIFTMFGTIEYVYSPYSIFWRNLKVFPNGWDTRIVIKNNSPDRESWLRINYLPDYNLRHSAEDCGAISLGSPAPTDVFVGPGGSKTVLLSEILGETLESSHQTEGSLRFFFVNPYTDHKSMAEYTDVDVNVFPLLTGGKRICDNP